MKKNNLFLIFLIGVICLLGTVFLFILNRSRSASGFRKVSVSGGKGEYVGELSRFNLYTRVAADNNSVRLGLEWQDFGVGFIQALVNPSIVEGKEELIVKDAGSTEIRYRLSETGVKEDIVLNQASEIRISYVYDLDLKNLITKRGVDNQWYFYDKETKNFDYPIFVIPQPVMIDAQGNRSYQIEISIKDEEGKRLLELRPDQVWLNDPQRVFPIKIDPTIEFIEYENKGQYENTSWVKNYLVRFPDYANLPVYDRSESSIHFRKPDGQVEAKFLSNKIHYQDGQGNWLPLDTTLVESGDEYGAPGIPVRIKKDGLVYNTQGKYAHRTLRVGVFDPQTKSFTSLASLGQRTFKENLSLWERDNLTHKIILSEKGITEFLEILSPAGLNLLEGQWLVMESQVNGIFFPDGWIEGNFTFEGYTFPAPKSTDAVSKPIETKRYALSKNGQQYFYTGIPLISLKEAAFPVVVDPDFSTYPSNDCRMHGTTNYSYNKTPDSMPDTTDCDGVEQTTLEVGQYYTDPSYGIDRPVLKFDTSSLHDLAEISDVRLGLTVQAIYHLNTHFTVQVVYFDWSDYEGMADYNDDLKLAWMGCINTSSYNNWQATNSLAVNTTYESSDALSNTWVVKTGETYFCLRSNRDYDDNVPTNYEKLYIYSEDQSGTSYDPYLEVTYNVPTIGCGTTKNDASSEIVVSWVSAGVGASVFQVQKRTDRGGFADLTTVGSGVSSTTDGSISVGHQYQYRIRARFATYDGDWCTTSELNLQSGNLNFEGVGLEGVDIN
jgi:hypothetical protein